MARTGRPGLSHEQKTELWQRWKAGETLSDIGRALGKHAASVFGVIAAKGGFAPVPRSRKPGSLTLDEREEISRRSRSFSWARLKSSFDTTSVSRYAVIHLFSVDIPTPRSSATCLRVSPLVSAIRTAS